MLSLIMGKVFLALVLILANLSQAQAQTPGTKKWEFTATGEVQYSPAIGADGIIYAWAMKDTFYEQPYRLYAINPNGTKKWDLPSVTGTDPQVGATPVIGKDGTIYLHGGSGDLIALNPDKTEKWRKLNMGTCRAAIAVDGTIFLSAWDGYIYAFNPDGSQKTKFHAPLGSYGYIYIGPDGTLYPLLGGNIFALKPDGMEKWRVPLNVGQSLAIHPDGTLYIAGTFGLLAMRPDGTQKWLFSTDWQSHPQEPVIGPDGTIYIGCDGSLLSPTFFYALNRDGTVKWKFQTSVDATEYFDFSPLIGADGTIYLASKAISADPTTSRVRAFNPDGTVKWQFFATALCSGLVMAPDGTLYVGSSGKKLYAIYTGSPGLSKSGWPMVSHDAQHTSRQPDKFVPGSPANFLLLE